MLDNFLGEMIKTGTDTNYPEDMTREQAGLIIKCKNLRKTYKDEGVQVTVTCKEISGRQQKG
jgi:hypothetical protein